VSVNDTTPEVGDRVTITVTPDTGKEVDKVIVKDANDNDMTVTDNGDGTYTYGNVTITVTFKVESPAPTVYTVTFNANGGTVSPTVSTTGADGKLTRLPIPTRDGYTFRGWFDAATGGSEVTVSTVFTENKTIYAQWTKNSVPIPPTPPVYIPPVHTCASKCEVCGKCMDTTCTKSVCTDKCSGDENVFTDVAEGAWYTEAVKYVYHRGMMEGVGNNLFDINGTTTRAMIVTILWRLEGNPW